jgi:hypothetical protein
MWKILGLVALGLAAGAGYVLFTRSEPAPKSLLVTAADAQSVDVQKSLAALDRRVRQLTAEVQSLRDSAGRATSGSEGGNSADGPQRGPADWQRMRDGRTPEDLAAMREQIQKRENERIIAAGLTPERMKEINRRAEELRVAAMQAQYEAQRNGQRVQGVDTDQALRKELGDAEYERYLKAEGRPTEVRVMDVLATSAAERSGLKAGDEILSYGGTRVFDARDLNALTMQGAAGGAVTVQVKRDGQTVQLSVPSGPLGVTAGPAGGGRQGGPGGRPGGFGGGGPGGGPGGGGPPGGFRPGG